MRRALLFASLLLPASLLADDDWTQFRGPHGTGISKATGLPTTWGDDTNVVWKTAIHDKGWSSPVVLGKQVWLTTALETGKAQWAVCVDRETGKVVHDIKVFDTPKLPYFAIDTYNSHASPSPVIEKGRVYVHFGSAGTACLDTDTGKILWTRTDLKCDHFRAPGSSPILWQDLLILTFDGHDKQYVTALDKANGKTVWTTDRSIDYKTNNGDAKKAYSTPTVIEVDGKPQLVSPAAMGTVAYDPRTGKEIWKVIHGGMNAATPPQFAHGKVFVTVGAGSKLVAVRPTGTGDVTKSHVDFTYPKEASSKPAPIVWGDLLFMVNDSGIVSCLDAKTGELIKKTRVAGSYSASPVLADGHLYCFDHDGKSFVLTADRELKVVASNKLPAGTRSTPAIAGKALFVRTYTHLYRFEKR
jgi:outer membrane protein assembly factor BamB